MLKYMLRKFLPFLLLSIAPIFATGQSSQTTEIRAGNIIGPVQATNNYALSSTYNMMANTYSGIDMFPSQLRIENPGDSTAGFHSAFVDCALGNKLGKAGWDMGGYAAGNVTNYGVPCDGYGQHVLSSTGTLKFNDGSVVPYDFTRSPTGQLWNVSSGGSVTFDGIGFSHGNVLKVYALKEPSDGITHATPGTITITGTSISTGPCPAGCTLGTVNLNNASTVAVVFQQTYQTASDWTIKVASASGAADIFAVGIYDTTSPGVINVGSIARGGLSLPDLVSNFATFAPWFASALGQPHNITAWSVTSNVATFTDTNAANLAVGQKVFLAAFPNTTALDGVGVTVASVSSGSWTANFTMSNGSATETGIGYASDSYALAMFEMKDNGNTNGSCQQSTTAAPSVYQNYSYWLNIYATALRTANPMMDMQFTGSYPASPEHTCLKTFNEVERAWSQANRGSYYDGYFNMSSAEMVQRGWIIPNNVHEIPAARIASAQQLWQQMGFGSFFAGAEQKPVASPFVMTSDEWFGQNYSPALPAHGMLNPANSATDSNNHPWEHTYAVTSSGGSVVTDVGGGHSWWDYTHTTCQFAILLPGGAAPNCKVTAGPGTSSSNLSINETDGNGAGGINFQAAGTNIWHLGTYLSGLGGNYFGLYDLVNSKRPFWIYPNSPTDCLVLTTANVTLGNGLANNCGFQIGTGTVMSGSVGNGGKMQETTSATKNANDIAIWDASANPITSNLQYTAVPQKVNTCGTTTTCSNTAQSSPRIAWGTVTLASGTATITGMTAWTSTTSFVCIGGDVTSAAAVKITNASTSSIVVTGTGTDVVNYQCTGN